MKQKLRHLIEHHGYAFAIACIAISTGLFLLGRGSFAKGQWALLYLLIIGFVAGLSGVRPALLAAVISFFTWNYFFLPPYHTFAVTDPKDWLSLFAFLLIGIAVGLQTGRLREREAEALAREQERDRLQVIAVQADALREADKLKTTLISSVSHELKTPLASITATVSNLLEQDVEWDAGKTRAELEAINEDLQRLNSSIGALLDLSRLESAAWEPKKDIYEFGEILVAVSKISQKLRNRITFNLQDNLPMINVDFLQWTRAIQNLLENALSYSPEDSIVEVGASASESELKMWVVDKGTGVPAQEKERIFE